MPERSRHQDQQRRRAAHRPGGGAGQAAGYRSTGSRAAGSRTAGARSAPGPSATDPTAAVRAAVDAAVVGCHGGAVRPARRLIEAVACPAPAGGDQQARGRGPESSDHVELVLADGLVAAVAAAWQNGWQPADLHRAVERRHGRTHARLVARAVGREAGRHPQHAVPPRWQLQLDAIGAVEAGRSGPSGGPWVLPAPGPAPGDDGQVAPARLRAVGVAVETLATLRSLPALPKLGPIPGERGAGSGRPTSAASARLRRSRGDSGAAVGADPRVLHKVTSLLAKAESTNFPDEAEALTSKAQQLMTRHAIDHAHLDAERGGPRVSARRIAVHDPYAGARLLLLAAVADANRCRAVWSKQWGFATLFGDEGDLDAVELLFTSLLVQATRAMVGESRPRAASAGSIRSFRHSFLVAFAHRIGDRLREAAEAVTAEAARRSTALVPVFEERRRAADAALDEAFPTVGTTRLSARNAAGWHAGRRAADQADLGTGASVPVAPTPRALS